MRASIRKMIDYSFTSAEQQLGMKISRNNFRSEVVKKIKDLRSRPYVEIPAELSDEEVEALESLDTGDDLDVDDAAAWIKESTFKPSGFIFANETKLSEKLRSLMARPYNVFVNHIIVFQATVPSIKEDKFEVFDRMIADFDHLSCFEFHVILVDASSFGSPCKLRMYQRGSNGEYTSEEKEKH